MSKLVIVESPAKVKTLLKVLGRTYKIIASFGHIRDLPKSKEGIEIENGFKPEFAIPKEKVKIVNQIKNASKEAEEILIATDPDREGEAIAYHIVEILKNKEKPFWRILLRELTPNAIKESFKEKRDISQELVNAQLARRILDRLMGYRLSPLLWKKLKRGLSAGRVQSVALKMVCKREEEIENFKKEEYWVFEAELQGKNGKFLAALQSYKGKKLKIPNEEKAKEVEKSLLSNDYIVSKVEKKEKLSFPPPPFTTAKLQQECHRIFKFPVKKTMQIAQKLYEGVDLGPYGRAGIITYMRTDSVRVSNLAISKGREIIEKDFGKEYLPQKPHYYKNKSKVQDAHEAIRPTRFEIGLEEMKKFLSADEFRIYSLIYKRFIASQMTPSKYDITNIFVDCGDYTFKASGKVLKFPGFLAIYKTEEEKEDMLPEVKEKEKLKLIDLKKTQKFTEPPPRYTEGTLVKALEEKGIGRPSTYSTIISTLQNRAYCLKEGVFFVPTTLGKTVVKLLDSYFNDIINENYTAKLEEKLDLIEEGKYKKETLLKNFYNEFIKDLERANANLQKIKAIPTDEICPKCGKALVVKFGKNGEFIACSGYPECNFTKSTMKEEEIEPCEKCGGKMVLKKGKYGFFYSCSNYPKCKNIRKRQSFKSEKTGVKCPKCDGEIVSRKGKKRIFYGCSNYQKCNFMQWYKPIPQECPECKNPFLNLKGKELICPNCGFAKKQ
mgnify:FL=1